MWNDADVPLAYLITFRCYGTWLHGDERGSVDRLHNQYQAPYIEPNNRRQQQSAAKLKGEPVSLDAVRRGVVEAAIRETCVIRDWLLLTVNVRTNHVHVIVSTGNNKPEIALNAFKANATRKMRQSGCWRYQYSPWSDKGSNRYLWNELSVERAVDYVINGQGDKLQV